MPGKLYIVATPIGNREDITDRAKRILQEVDVIAAEDTRTTRKLLHLLGIQNQLVSNHKFNERKQLDFLLSRLEQGRDMAVVSDAGTPCISDPGAILVEGAVERGIEVVGVCGASSVITALSVSGFRFTSFAFYGFLPRENKEIREILGEIREGTAEVSVFFESPKRIQRILEIVTEELPDCGICLCNDLTKLYERIYRGTPQQVLAEVSGNPSAQRGEYTLVLNTKAYRKQKMTEPAEPGEALSKEALLVDHLVKNGGSLKEAIQALQEQYKGQISKKELYRAGLHIKAMAQTVSDYGDNLEGES